MGVRHKGTSPSHKSSIYCSTQKINSKVKGVVMNMEWDMPNGVVPIQPFYDDTRPGWRFMDCCSDQVLFEWPMPDDHSSNSNDSLNEADKLDAILEQIKEDPNTIYTGTDGSLPLGGR